MTRALIGHTGFVGSNLDRQSPFDARFNSRNIETMRGRRFSEVWCAGVQAVKWWANANPEEDRRGISSLLDVLETVEAERFVLLSTVDVFARPVGVDEATRPGREGLHAYGRHRLDVEERIAARFPDCLIVRLPGLFGEGLKKNVIYDLMTDNQVEKIHPDARFQFYGLDRLTRDIGTAATTGAPLVHLVTEPVAVSDVARVAFGRDLGPPPVAEPVRYDVRTRHASAWGEAGAYVAPASRVLDDIAAFVADRRSA